MGIEMNTEEGQTESARFLPLPTMRLTIEIVGYGFSTITLPDQVAAWIMEVANIAHVLPATLCGSVVGDVAREDMLAHQEPSVLQ